MGLRKHTADGGTPVSRLRLKTLTLYFATTLLAGACAARGGPPGGLAGAPAAPAAVERFLQLAADRDYAAMGWVFGTSDGAIIQRDPASQVEQRMYALASLLEYDSFVIGDGAAVPGRTGSAIQFDVQVLRGAESLAIPFIAVRGPDGRWFVEQFAVEPLTAS